MQGTLCELLIFSTAASTAQRATGLGEHRYYIGVIMHSGSQTVRKHSITIASINDEQNNSSREPYVEGNLRMLEVL